MNNIKSYIRGWIIGNFEPSVLKTRKFDVGVKYYKTRDIEEEHYHKRCTEYSIIISGKHAIGGDICEKGDILIVKPYERKKYLCLKSGAIVVIKVPSGKGDKYR